MPHYYLPEHFKKQLKRYLKKFPALIDDVVATLITFDPHQHISLGEDAYKIRLRAADLPKGKSKSFRLIILLLRLEDAVVPLTLYLKSEQATISKAEIRWQADCVRAELDTLPPF